MTPRGVLLVGWVVVVAVVVWLAFVVSPWVLVGAVLGRVATVLRLAARWAEERRPGYVRVRR